MAAGTTNVLAVELTLASKWILDPSSTSFPLTGGGQALLEGHATITGHTRPHTLVAALEPWDDGLRLRATGIADRLHFPVIASPTRETGPVLGSTLTLWLDALLRCQPNPLLRLAWRDIP